MSEPILMALVQLFAIVAASTRQEKTTGSRKILESYLRQHLNAQELEEYLKLFDELLFFHQPDEGDANEAEVSAKIEAICLKIRKQITIRDRIIVFMKFLEFLKELSDESPGNASDKTGHSEKYIDVLRRGFNQPEAEFREQYSFVMDPTAAGVGYENLAIIDGFAQEGKRHVKHIHRDKLDGRIMVLFVPSVRTIFGKYTGSEELYLNGHPLIPNRTFILSNGSILKNPKINPVYYTDVAAQFLRTAEKAKVSFSAKEVEYRFKNSRNGLQPFSFTAESGELIGVMGGSGVGKSTLLNVLNGNLPMNGGSILINGHDLAREKETLQGMIGFVPQDDLLIEELTVFQNLYYNAKLCFRDYSDRMIKRTVMRVLMDIDLIGARNLTVGDPLNKFISGGQRKRLNIALELVREPAILFVDEPTSGLSSTDSEMVMLLLKEQTLKGRLVIVNIHQPSSDIYKLFDKLLVMDKGGYPIYYGNPIDALGWFKSASYHVNPDESECQNCGYVNPEQLLQITESKIVNEYGRVTGNRKTSPKEWYNLFRQHLQPKLISGEKISELPPSDFHIPGKFRQFRIFSVRNLLAKLSNRQYMVINLVEAPFLAALLAYLTRYKFGDDYQFIDNRNLVAYLFMSVVVALFLGMMVSAEEIFRDRRLLKREAFLHLSRFSYINSKIAWLFTLSGIQMWLYVITGNLILGIEGMNFSFWLLLFATACCANLVGLNISSGLNSIVAIYILIPFILVPQLLLSGTIVPFDYLNPSISSRENVPLVGNMMTSRWTFEALAVDQFSNNSYEAAFFDTDKELSGLRYTTSYVIPALKSEIDLCRRNIALKLEREKTLNSFSIIRNEVAKLEKEAGFSALPAVATFSEQTFTDSVAFLVASRLDSLTRWYSARMGKVSRRSDAIHEAMVGKLGTEGTFALKKRNYNENLSDLVRNKGAANMVIKGRGKLIRKYEPVFMNPDSRWGNAHFYAPVKFIGSLEIRTFWFNFIFIWLQVVVLYLFLWHDTLRKVLNYFSGLKFRKAG